MTPHGLNKKKNIHTPSFSNVFGLMHAVGKFKKNLEYDANPADQKSRSGFISFFHINKLRKAISIKLYYSVVVSKTVWRENWLIGFNFCKSTCSCWLPPLQSHSVSALIAG